MEIAIRGYLAASKLIVEQPSSWDCIAIIDSDSQPHPKLQDYARRVLVLKFDDIETPAAPKVLPTKDHIENALSFAQESERLIVSCRAGQSRSAAVAYLIAAQDSNPRQALEILDSERHRPNSQIIDLGSSLIDQPTLHPCLKQWRDSLNGLPINTRLFESEISQLIDSGVTDTVSQ